MNLPPPLQAPKVFQPPQQGEVIVNGKQRYFLGAAIGQGYFGSVYECTDDWANELVAKVLVPRNRPYPEIRQHWLAELGNLVLLRHPNITFVYDAFEYRDTFYLIIERCSSTLTDLLATPGFDGTIWLPYVARELLQGVNFLHAAGYVHKDLYADNVFLVWLRDRMVPTKQPVLTFKIGDLGITRLESDINVFNTLLAEWMLPPEFLDPGQFGFVGRAVDLYHVGLLLLSLLLGKVTQFTRDDVLAGAPRQLAEGLQSPFAPVLAKLLRRHVVSRTPSAMQLWLEIREVAYGF